MEEIKIKDIIFSFRHTYLENTKKTNKRLKKHVTLDSKLINDISLYLKSSEQYGTKVGIRYIFKDNSIGNLVYLLCDKFGINSKLMDYGEIRKNHLGNYISNTSYVHVKDQKISKEIECIKKEEFYKNICASYNSSNMRVSFNETEIMFACADFILCYNSVGDLLYSYSPNPMDIDDILKTQVNIDNFLDYHKNIIKKERKSYGFDRKELEESFPGDYLIKENNDRIVLKKLKNGKLPRYI